MSSINKIYIHVPTPEISRKVQKILFSVGCTWPLGSTDIKFERFPVLLVINDHTINFSSSVENIKDQAKRRGNIEIDCSWMENIED